MPFVSFSYTIARADPSTTILNKNDVRCKSRSEKKCSQYFTMWYDTGHGLVMCVGSLFGFGVRVKADLMGVWWISSLPIFGMI